MRRVVRQRLRQPDYVEDIVQDTLLSVHHYRHTYDPERPFGPWLYAIARHRWLDFVRKQKRRSENEVLAEPGWEDLTQAPAEHGGGLSGSLHAALARLSQTQREVIRLLKLEGYSVAEISRRTGRSESSVKITAHRGYKTLRKLIVRHAREQ